MLQLLFIAMIFILHFALGWVWPIIATALVITYVVETHQVSKAAILGGFVNTIGIAYSWYYYPKAASEMIESIDSMLFNISPFIVPLLTLIIPTILYALAAHFNSNLIYYIRSYRQNRNVPDANLR